VSSKRERLDVAARARSDIVGILKTSFKEFGEAASNRYRVLIEQAMDDIGEDPERQGSKERPGILIPGARTYHIEFSRTRVSGRRVKEPRHFILYRIQADGRIEIARILHDSRELALHLPEKYRSEE
jgi:toxin ParE1/3/4